MKETSAVWDDLQHKTVFLSCSADMAHAVALVNALIDELNSRVPRGDHWEFFHWSKSDHPWPTGRTWQENIPRPSDSKVDAVICLIGERLGEPLPDYFPLPTDLPLPEWVEHPWLQTEHARVPLTGTLFELLDALVGPARERLRDRTLTYVKVDPGLFTKPGIAADDRQYGFEQHYDRLKGGAKRIRDRQTDEYYRLQLGWVDRFCEEFFRKPSRPAICFGKAGQTVEESLIALRTKLLPDLERLFGLKRHSGPVELKGLNAYQPEDADILFGRDRAIERIFETLNCLATPFVALTGRSGEGKSSVLRAGLVGRLRLAQYPRFDRFLPVLFDSFALTDQNPLEIFAAEIDKHLPQALWNQEHELGDFLPAERVAKFVDAVRRSLGAAPQIPRVSYRLFIAIDQFEELLIPAIDDPDLGRGLRDLLSVLGALAKERLAWVTVTLPIEHEQTLRNFALNSPEVNFVQLAPIGEDDIRDIVAKSFGVAGFRSTVVHDANLIPRDIGIMEAAARTRKNDVAETIEAIVTQAGDWLKQAENPGPVLPLLSVLLTEFVKARRQARQKKIPGEVDRPEVMTLAGVLGRLGERAWTEARKTPSSGLDMALSRLLRQLVTTGTSDSGRIKLLRNCPADHPAVINAKSLVEAMRRARLLYRPSPSQIRLAHITIIDHWERTEKWYAEDQKHHLVLASLVEQANAWHRARASDQFEHLVTNPNELDALEDLWWAWYDDCDRLPLEFMRASVKAAFDPLSRPESWLRADGSSRFISIAASNDEELLRHALSRLRCLSDVRRLAIVNFASPKTKSTAVKCAALRGNANCVRWLLDAGARVNVRDNTQWTPLHEAALNGHDDVAQLLLVAGSEVNARAQMQLTPLHIASHDGHEGVAQLLLEAGAEVNARAETQLTPLHIASQEGHEGVVQILLEAGAEVNAHDDKQRTPLHWAAQNGHQGTVRLLLEAGTEVDARAHRQVTPLHMAADEGHGRVMRILLEVGAEVDARTDTQLTPLHAAAESGHADVARLLLEVGAKVGACGDTQWTPLHGAALNGHDDVARLLLEAGAEVNTRDDKQRTPLHAAALNGHQGVVQLLLEACAEVNTHDDKQWTPLHMAAQDGHEGMVRLLLEAGAEVSTRVEKQWTPLHLAAQNGHEGVARLLLEAGTEGDARTDTQMTPLHLAARNGHDAVVRLLLEVGAEVNVRNDTQCTPLHMTSPDGHEGMVRLLLDAGAEVDARDHTQWTPLHRMAQNGHEGVARLLLEVGAEVDARTDTQMTPLCVAALRGHDGVARLLLESKANVDARLYTQMTPLHLTAGNGHDGVARLLLEAGAEVDARTDTQITPLHAAALYSHEGVVHLLLEAGAEIDARTATQLTPLHAAAEGGHEGVVRLLLEVGAEVNAHDDKQGTPLHLAAVNGHDGVVRLLLEAGAEEET